MNTEKLTELDLALAEVRRRKIALAEAKFELTQAEANFRQAVLADPNTFLQIVEALTISELTGAIMKAKFNERKASTEQRRARREAWERTNER